MSGEPRREQGFTLVEVLAAMVLFLVVLVGITFFFASNQDSSYASQREVSQLSVAQGQIENIRQLAKRYGFSALALSSNPATKTDSTLPTNPPDPNDYIVSQGTSSESYEIMSNYNDSTAGVASNTPSTGETLLDPNTGTTGQVTQLQYVDLSTGTSYLSTASVPSTGGVKDPYAVVNTFVTQASTVAGCNAGVGTCASSDTRRVIVAVELHNPNATNDYAACSSGVVGPKGRCDLGPSTPTYTSTIFVNPIASNQTGSASGLRILGLIS